MINGNSAFAHVAGAHVRDLDDHAVVRRLTDCRRTGVARSSPLPATKCFQSLRVVWRGFLGEAEATPARPCQRNADARVDMGLPYAAVYLPTR